MSNNKDVDFPLDDAEVHENQKYEADKSPDYFAEPKRGRGVRRLNKLPLLIVGVLLLLAVGGMTYTFLSRQEAAQVQKKDTTPPIVKDTARPPVRPSGADFVAPESLAPNEVAANPGEPANAGGVAPAPVVSEAMQRRLQVIQQIEEKRLAKWEAALDSDGVIQNFSQKASTPTPGAPDGSQLASAGSRISPQEVMQRYMAAGAMSNMGEAGGMGGMVAIGGMAAENGQTQKRAFLAGTPEANVYLANQRKAPIAPTQEIKAGTVIPGVMVSGINSDLPGQIIGRVAEAVYDSATGSQLLIPPGSTLIGSYDSGVTLGQSRALVVWKRIIYPDSSSISLDGMPGANQGGYAGFHDKVNNHYFRIFGHGLLLSLFSAGIQLSQPQAQNGENYSSSQIIAGSLGQQMGQLGMQIAQRNMNIQPTLQIRPGYEFNVMVTKDIILPTWDGHPLANHSAK